MKIIASVITFLFVIDVFALTQQAFIKKVLSQDTHFEKDKIYVAIKQIELETSKSSYADWDSELSASLSNSYYDINKDTTSTSIYEKQRYKNSQSIELSTEKKFLSNPSVLTLSLKRSTPDADITRYKQDVLYTGSNAQYSLTTFDNTYTVNYKYPLLKHDSNATSLKSYRRNILDLDREKLDFDDAQEAFLVDRLEQFIDWYFYQKNAEIYQQYQQSLEAIKGKTNKDKAKISTAILRANQDILTNNSKLQALKKSLVTALNDTSLWSEKPKVSINKQPKIMPDLAQYLRRNVRTLLKVDIDKRLKKIDLDYYKNQSLFKLDFNIGAEKNHNKGNTMTTHYDNESVLYTTSLDFSAPIGVDVNNQKDIAVAKLTRQKLDIDYNNKLKDILADAQALLVELDLGLKTLNQYEGLLLSVKNNTNSALENYLNQSITIQALIEAYREKRDIKLDYIEAFTGYQNSLLEYNDALDRVLY